MATRLDISADGAQRKHELNNLAATFASTRIPEEENYQTIATIFKVLAIMAGIFLTLAALSTMRPDMAFISVTLIVITTGTFVLGSEKIARLVVAMGIWNLFKSLFSTPRRGYDSDVQVHHYHYGGGGGYGHQLALRGAPPPLRPHRVGMAPPQTGAQHHYFGAGEDPPSVPSFVGSVYPPAGRAGGAGGHHHFGGDRPPSGGSAGGHHHFGSAT